MCLDHPDKVEKACFVDMLPQHHLLNNVTFNWGKFSWHWFFMIQPTPYPETMISNDAEFFLRKKLSKTDQGTKFFVPEALEEYIRCIKNPRTVYAMCEDYRATVSCDLEMDTADFNAGKRVTCPTFLLWGAPAGSAAITMRKRSGRGMRPILSARSLRQPDIMCRKKHRRRPFRPCWN